MGYNLKDLATDIVKGDLEYVPQETKRKRIEICNVCEHNRMQLCKLCGCMIQMKTTLKKASCPIGKW